MIFFLVFFSQTTNTFLVENKLVALLIFGDVMAHVPDSRLQHRTTGSRRCRGTAKTPMANPQLLERTMNATIHTRTPTFTRARRNSALLLAAALFAAGLATKIQAAEPVTPAEFQIPIARLLDAKLAARLAKLPLRTATTGDIDIAREDGGWRTPPVKLNRNVNLVQTVQEKSS
ncbi:MAG: hypothetical protein KBG75_13855 [Pseudomonadales bacterium]|nr:hypothetical protein [Pseudomonadales bacterium]